MKISKSLLRVCKPVLAHYHYYTDDNFVTLLFKSNDQKIPNQTPPVLASLQLSELPWNFHRLPLGLALIYFRLRIGQRRLSWSDECKIWGIFAPRPPPCQHCCQQGVMSPSFVHRGVGYNLLPPGTERGGLGSGV